MSNFVVSARKYRPLRFEDVVGQEHITQTLKNALQNDHLAHAFLFCGPRGVGKTTCARILAKVLNCQNVGENLEPCGECTSCKSFQENASFNITELDAASNNSVEHIRTLVEQVRFQPQQGKYKVFIIDEVHMLSQSAFNAFLKTLEEPPPYAIFILATTEKHKIIPTILSRCQIFDFRRIQTQDMVSHLQTICEQEHIEADSDALHIIAQKADGALRDSLSIFDRIVSFSGNRVRYEDVISNLNVLDYDYYFQIVDALLIENMSKILLLFDDILRHGFEPDIFMNGLAEHIRNLLVCKDVQTLQLLEISDSLKERYQQQARLAPSAFLLTALNLANDCDINYKMARNKRLHVEMALIKMAHIHRAMQPNVVLEVQSTGSSIPNTATTSPEKKTPEPSVIASESIEKQAVQESKAVYSTEEEIATAVPPIEQQPVKNGLRRSKKHSTPEIKSVDKITAELKQQEQQENGVEKIPVELEAVKQIWKAYADAVQQGSVQHVLRSTELALEEDTIVATVSSAFSENMVRQEVALLNVLRESFQRPDLALEIRLDERKAATKPAPKVQKVLTAKDKYLQMEKVNPLVREVLNRFELTPDEE